MEAGQGFTHPVDAVLELERVVKEEDDGERDAEHEQPGVDVYGRVRKTGRGHGEPR